MSKPTFTPDRLRAFVTDIYRASGARQADAALLADTLVQADLWGHPSHGVMRTIWYRKRMGSGAISLTAEPELAVDAGALAVIDGHDGIGQVIAGRAMDEAIARAKAHGVGLVAVRRSGHFGTAMYFTRRAAQAGCIGLLTTNASPAMAPWGGREKRVGTNPWSIAAPTNDPQAPMLLDTANTVVARGKLYVAQKKGEPIPLGWAMDEHGRPTTDPVAGIAGTIMPMAGHKGYAIAMMMDVLSGILPGSNASPDIVGPFVTDRPSGAGHLAMAIDIAAVRPLADFKADLRRYIDTLKQTPLAEGAEEIFYPGEMSARTEAAAIKAGLALPAAVLDELNEGARDLGLPELGPT